MLRSENGANGMNDMAGYAARVAVEPQREAAEIQTTKMLCGRRRRKVRSRN